MDKKLYLQSRANLQMGNIDNACVDLLYDFWLEKREPDFKELSRDDFQKEFLHWLQVGNPNLNLNNIINYYDEKFTVVTVKDKENRLLAML